MGHRAASSVLLVEDNEDLREGLSALLESEGYEVVAVGTAEKGLARIQARSFDLVVTDYMLPGETGRWMLEQAVAAGLLDRARAIMITAHPRVTPPQGVRLLHKPLELEEFLRVVEAKLEAGRQREAKAS